MSQRVKIDFGHAAKRKPGKMTLSNTLPAALCGPSWPTPSKDYPMRHLIIAVLALVAPVAAMAQNKSPYTRAQALADNIVVEHPGMIDAIMHVSPTVDAKNIVIAAHLRHANGEASGEDDLGVMRTGAPLVEVQKDGVRIGVLVQMRDAQHRVIGALGLMYPYKTGDDPEAALRRSFAIRDALAKRVPSRAALIAAG